MPPELRRTTVPAPARDWIARHAGVRVAVVRRLPGASSSAVHAVTLADGRRLVLRRYVWTAVVDEEPAGPAREAAAMRWARLHGLPAPEVVAADPDGSDVGDGVAAVLMTRLPGRPEVSPDVPALAGLAARVHEVPAEGFPYDFSPWCRETCTRAPANATDPGLWERAIALRHLAAPVSTRSLLHRDFHPGNVLCRRRRPIGIVDWVNACAGPPGVDVSTCRWNLADWAGEQAADAFVREYELRVGFPHHPYWDLDSLLSDDYDLGVPDRRVASVQARLEVVLPRVEALAA